ncbi:phenylacetate--CoA ligase family protein [Halorussus caseinilyticus]|uniref:Phenylacetate--CoA ligase family protein n=1 Tax=Halorussus caseinilyticus TaxID=3034025 RepID=A0ABD5WEK4_9EURY
MSEMWNPILETMALDDLRAYQLDQFREQVEHAKDDSPFYAEKLSGISPDDITSLADVRELPTTTKDELREAQREGDGLYGDLLAEDAESVVSYHQTSGTTGRPVRQADSLPDWEWWTDSWATVLWAQGVRPDDRVFLPFSYSVFVAFWAAHAAAERIGAEVIPGGGMSSAQRVEKIETLDPTVVAVTPTYAFRLAEVAEQEGIDLAETAIETVVCAGEPGASVPSTKDELEALWGADVYDHAGATEAGAWGFACDGDTLGLHFNEARFLVEVLDGDDEPVGPGETGRLVVTPLNRSAQPYVRSELKDRIRLAEESCDCGRTFRVTDGGVLGREDEFRTINGTLLSPRAVEDVVHGYDPVTNEFRVRIEDHPEKDLDTLELRVEADGEYDYDADRIATELDKELKKRTHLSFDVDVSSPGTLDRNELKSDRFTDARTRRTQYEQ